MKRIILIVRAATALLVSACGGASSGETVTATAQGGSIWAESTLGEGTTFRFALCLVQPRQ